MACTFQSGAGSPVGVAVPKFVGQLYYDTTNHEYWRSTGLTNADWEFVGGLPFATWSPATEIATWTDGGGAGQVGDLATFTANADLATLSDLNLNLTAITTLTCRYCPSLVTLNVQNCNLTSLNLVGCYFLNTLGCQGNSLASLALSGCPSLTTLDCSYNSLVNLDLSGHAPFRDLFCQYNSLTGIDLTGCSSANNITCNNNLLASITLTSCVNLAVLNIAYNSLVALDVTACTAIGSITCNNNSLTTITGIAPANFYNLVAQNNNFTTGPGGSVNVILDTISSTAIQSGFIDISLQTPLAPPDAGPPDGVTAKATLIGKGWAVNTD